MNMTHYWIEKSNFNLNVKTLSKNAKGPISISPDFKRDIIELDGDNAIVKISIIIKQTDSIPFDIDVVVCGSFNCERWKESDEGQSFIKYTSVQILFPYLRQAVATITGMANIPQYVLPVINVKELFKD